MPGRLPSVHVHHHIGGHGGLRPWLGIRRKSDEVADRPLLAASAGAADVVAFFGLGNAFGGIVTGNPFTAGYGVAASRASLTVPAVTAVAGCIAGEIAWARALRGPATATRLLLGEVVLFLLVLRAPGSRPADGGSMMAPRHKAPPPGGRFAILDASARTTDRHRVVAGYVIQVIRRLWCPG